jgi:hypothetical protein
MIKLLRETLVTHHIKEYRHYKFTVVAVCACGWESDRRYEKVLAATEHVDHVLGQSVTNQ